VERYTNRIGIGFALGWTIRRRTAGIFEGIRPLLKNLTLWKTLESGLMISFVT